MVTESPPGRADRAALWRARAAFALPYALAISASIAIGVVAARAIVERAGEPALPLDDSFIHLQYARRFAEGHAFSYVDGEGPTTGATSLLWPLALAPFVWLGGKGLALIYPAWVLGWIAHGALAVETAKLAAPLAGRPAAVGAGLACLAFGGFAWFASSGMETMPFAWALVWSARRSATWLDDARARTAAGRRWLVAAAAIAALLRPEGALAAVIAAVALARAPLPSTSSTTSTTSTSSTGSNARPTRLPSALASALRFARPRAPALAPLAFAALPAALAFATTGQARSSTAVVKWLVGNPNYASSLLTSIGDNVHLLWSSVLDGGDWTAIFVPEGSRFAVAAGLAGLVATAARTRRAHAFIALALALGTLVPCTYLSFLWNRLRYVWPFAPAVFVGFACFSREIVYAARHLDPRALSAAPALTALAAGLLASRLPWALGDLAQSADAIAKQQVALARWAAEALPADARVGVNDTGAIAYLSGRRTFDVVGLTTRGEAEHWVAGAGSRYEHYERLEPAARPTHFIVYPEWMACDAVLGRELTSRTVTDQSILGGATMVAYEATYEAVGSGEAPWSRARSGQALVVVDRVDVADLVSEREHAFRGEPVADGWNVARLALANAEAARDGDGATNADEPPTSVADGGRTNRTREAFEVHADAGALVVRAASEKGATLTLRVARRRGAEPAAEPVTLTLQPGPWREHVAPLVVEAGDLVEVRAEAGVFDSFHYFAVAAP